MCMILDRMIGVWIGMERNGVEWNGVEWNKMGWHGRGECELGIGREGGGGGCEG